MLTTLTARVLDGSTRSSGARFDAYRVDGTFHIDIDLPGADTASIDITVDGVALTVRAERCSPEREGPASARQFALSERFDTDRLEARYADGVLNLSIPVLSGAGGGGEGSVRELEPVQVDEVAPVVSGEREKDGVHA
ncbi:hypothetical protein Q0Z83_103490 [Actinoplanes sichuanensis]|uniref:Hsp20/alpha crystallin family protein n=1 Tax=Actinoplanes sichuanensis TaxID=512349 RepID=A0ABW4AIV2_9ACTN|nr:Hsp20/alpha crystallin family protein [Actinoplanes sichuanensis]BEL12158.1 hypothetical protein Q0Z83_103490 [Actinoplanes sichuanensis]